MSRAHDAAGFLAEIVERGKTSGRPGSDNDLADVLDEALDPYALARLVAIARTRLRALTAARVREDAIRAGYLRPVDGAEHE